MSTIDPYKHLTMGAREALTLPPDQRLKWFRSDKWIEYDVARQALARMEDLLTHPKVTRMPNLLLIGQSNNGKTSILDRMCALHPPEESEEGLVVPVLSVQAPSGPDELRLFNNILCGLNIPYSPNDSIRKREPQIHGVLNALGVRLLLIDEIHNSLAGSIPKQRQFLNAIRILANRLQISIVAAGTREAGRALSVDPQLANRFEPFRLTQWGCNQEWQKLIASFERLLPLPEASGLGAASPATRLYELAEGWIGELKSVLTACLVTAVREGKPRIDSVILSKVAFVPPSKRRSDAERPDSS
ncbi:MAG TPA: TniB family NTP-binding protein [Solimonas sp.]